MNIDHMTPSTSGNMKRQIIITTLIYLMAALTGGQQLDLTYRIREEQETGTYVGNVARDSYIYNQFNQSEFQNLEYRIPSTISKLSIDSKTSTIRTTQILDREEECDDIQTNEPCTINFDVSVYRVNSDGSFNLLRIVKVKLFIEDINDNAPQFPSNETTLNVPESIEVNQVLRTSGAVDKDTSLNNTVQTYSLEGGGDVFDLQVIPNPGGNTADLGIILKRKLDREMKSSYHLKIVAEDGGFPRLRGSSVIIVKVLDVNDNTPLFTKVSFDTAVAENTPLRKTILTLEAEDPDEGDNGKLTFTFSSPTSAKVIEYFDINESSGEIYLIKGLDYEKDKTFRFFVKVNDNGTPSRSSKMSVLITVLDVNDNAPQIDITLPSAYVKESIGIGNYIAHVSLSDFDSSENSNMTCHIANDHFTLQKFPGSDSIFTVILNNHLDYEKQKTELVNVTCQDGGQPPMSNSSSFILHVQDVNDNAPIFTRSPYQASIRENNYLGQFVAQVQAVDPDEGNNGDVAYSVIQNPKNKFQINSVSGVIKAMYSLDREERNSYELVVLAKDKGAIPNSSTVTVTVLVADVNDNPPYFTKPYFEMRVDENKPKNTVIDTVLAADPDTAFDSHLRFKFTGNFSYADTFGIDPISGSIYTLTTLNREAKDTYEFNVMVYDDSEPKFLDVARVTVMVKDENDNKPNIIFPSEFNNTFNILYTQPVGSVLLTVQCQDDDAGENATVKLSILQGNHKGLFFINSLNGQLVVAKRINIYEAGTYTLIILARDEGRLFLESMRDINIVVTVANGTASYLQEDEGSANIAIVIALVCITAVLAMAVLITICIIRRIDRERKRSKNVRGEEENIYKQATTDSLVSTTCKDSFETEIEKLKGKIKRDMSFVVEDDTNTLESTDVNSKSSTFSTFKNTSPASVDHRNLSTPQAYSSVLQNTLSSSEGNVKRVHYMDKGVDIHKLTSTSSPTRRHPTYQSGRGSYWSGSRTQSPHSSVIKFPVEDVASHSSGSTSDSGRGGSSEEGDGHAVVVAIGDVECPVSKYPTSAKLMTFGSPRSNEFSSGTSYQPRSLSTSLNSDTAKKRLWGDSTPTKGTSITLSSGLSADSPFQMIGMSDSLQPNISFSDDSVTANATAGINGNKDSSGIRNRRNDLSNSQAKSLSSSSDLLNCMARASDPLRSPPKTVPPLTSTQRPKVVSHSTNSDTPYKLLPENLSGIQCADTSTRHGTFIDGTNTSLLTPSGSVRSRSYANTHRLLEHDRDMINAKAANSKNVKNTSYSDSHNKWTGDAVRSPLCNLTNETQSTSVGEPYSLADLKDVLEEEEEEEESTMVAPRQDDDNTTTTSGSYTINAEDLCHEIDQLFFNDVVV